MKFKSNAQRKAVMASLKDKNFRQIQKRGVFLRKQGDIDRDGIVNIKDCRPLDKNKQGWLHDRLKRREKKMDEDIKKEQVKLEKKQDNMLAELDKESTTLKKHLVVQKKIDENKRIKQELKELKAANFAHTKTGKVVAITKAKSKKTKKFLKKLFK